MAKEKTAKKSTGGGKVMVEGLLTEDGLAKKLSPYNKFVKTEIAKMKSEKPGLGHQEEIIAEILSYLEVSDVLALAAMSRQFQAACSSERVWKGLVVRTKNIAYRDPSESWRRVFYSADIGEACRHINALADPEARAAAVEGFWRTIMALVDGSQGVRCYSCGRSLPDLWMCLEPGCYVIGCGRRQAAHALKHFNAERHFIAVKLRTLECWCYGCKKWLGVMSGPKGERYVINDIINRISSSLPRGSPIQPTTFFTSRRQFERELAREAADDHTSLINNTTYFVCTGWMQAWYEFLLGNADPPGRIDNSPLLTTHVSASSVAAGASSHLVNPAEVTVRKMRRNVIAGLDFALIRPSTWEYLHRVYGIPEEEILNEESITDPEYNYIRLSVAALKAEAARLTPEELYSEDTDESVMPPSFPLHTNLPKNVMCYRDVPFASETHMYPPHADILSYLETYAQQHNLNPLIQFSTEVVRAEYDDAWNVTTLHVDTGKRYTREFDAILVCSGHYTVPYIPDIPGLSEYKRLGTESGTVTLKHARDYRHPDIFADKTAIVIGGGFSAVDVAREATGKARKVYQSVRSFAKGQREGGGSTPEVHQEDANDWEAKINQVPEIARFVAPTHETPRGAIVLMDGTTLTDVDFVLFGTGYLYTLPFLPQYTSADGHIKEDTLLTDGMSLLNLYLHLVYMSNPTMAFVGLPMKIVPLPMAQMQSLLVSKIWAGKAELPSIPMMRQWYDTNMKDEHGQERGRERMILGAPAEAHYLNLMYRWIVTGEVNGETEEIIDKVQRPVPIGGGQVFVLNPRYNIIRAVGQGAYGTVCSAVDTRTNECVAIKKVSRIFDKPILTKRCLREIKLLQHFNGHSNIIGILDMDIPDKDNFKDVYLIQPCMDTTLSEIIHSAQNLQDVHLQWFTYQILCGLKFIHSAHVVHRDLKPANILVNANCDLRICDFGLARGFHDQQNDAPTFMTQYVATRWYRAPEIMLSFAGYTQAIDMWSVGCIFGELLGGEVMFRGDNYVDQLNRILRTLGVPDDNDPIWSKMTSETVVKYIQRLKHANTNKLSSKQIDFSLLYPQATPLAIQFLQEFLFLDPDRRITADEALQHPYLVQFSSPEDEISCPKRFDFDALEAVQDQDELRKLIVQDVQRFKASLLTKKFRKIGNVVLSLRGFQRKGKSYSGKPMRTATASSFIQDPNAASETVLDSYLPTPAEEDVVLAEDIHLDSRYPEPNIRSRASHSESYVSEETVASDGSTVFSQEPEDMYSSDLTQPMDVDRLGLEQTLRQGSLIVN
ncbi:hypothetical protein BZG36_02294 [Bifiguratus adelaidae]|uniref:Mitogen-activated protein kinase n=1 Tax=Bifiguratus adelaidae TaxID=1938954 RepID=A0A261Y3T7_9FUNG|nr:hypothetical protein BZG36_02294 [Bifiguratus adelaidae]